MQYDAKTPQEYLEMLDDDWRRSKLLELRALIVKSGPEYQECIRYKMLGYCRGEKFVFQLNAQKGYVSLYVGDHRKIDPDGTILKGVNKGKGCIRFGKSVVIEDSGAEQFIRKTLELVAAGVDTSCY